LVEMLEILFRKMLIKFSRKVKLLGSFVKNYFLDASNQGCYKSGNSGKSGRFPTYSREIRVKRFVLLLAIDKKHVMSGSTVIFWTSIFIFRHDYTREVVC